MRCFGGYGDMKTSSQHILADPFTLLHHLVDLYLIYEKSIRKNQVQWTGFLVYLELDFYCLCSLQKSISKLIFAS